MTKLTPSSINILTVGATPLEPRRSDPRHDRKLPIVFVFEAASYIAHTRNISVGGVFIETPVRLAWGARITVSLQLPTLAEILEVGGEVRWIEDTEQSRGMGVRLDGLRAKEVWALNKFLAGDPAAL